MSAKEDILAQYQETKPTMKSLLDTVKPEKPGAFVGTDDLSPEELAELANVNAALKAGKPLDTQADVSFQIRELLRSLVDVAMVDANYNSPPQGPVQVYTSKVTAKVELSFSAAEKLSLSTTPTLELLKQMKKLKGTFSFTAAELRSLGSRATLRDPKEIEAAEVVYDQLQHKLTLLSGQTNYRGETQTVSPQLRYEVNLPVSCVTFYVTYTKFVQASIAPHGWVQNETKAFNDRARKLDAHLKSR